MIDEPQAKRFATTSGEVSAMVFGGSIHDAMAIVTWAHRNGGAVHWGDGGGLFVGGREVKPGEYVIRKSGRDGAFVFSVGDRPPGTPVDGE